MRIRQFNKIVGFIGLLAILIAPVCLSLSLTEYLLVVLAVSTVEILVVYIYRKHRFHKSKPTPTI